MKTELRLRAALDAAKAIEQRADAAGRPMNSDELKQHAAHLEEARTLKADLESRKESMAFFSEFTGSEGSGAPSQRCGEFDSFGEFLQAVRGAALQPSRADARLFSQRATGASEAVPSDGGFLVGTDFSREVMRKIHNAGQLVSRVRHIPISANSNGIKLNVIDESSRATGSRSGAVRLYWVAEGGTMTASRPKFRQITMDLQKVAGLFYATDELLEDSAALAAEAERSFIEEFAFVFDDMIFRGVGVGQPLGFMNSPCLITVAKEAGQAADSVVTENLNKMWSRLAAGSERTAVWLVAKDVWPQLLTLNVALGTAGTPVFLPAGGISGQPYATIYGRPVVTCEQSATLGDLGDVALVDPAQYLWIEKGGIQAASSIHVQFLAGEQVFKWTARVNGQPAWNAALTPYQGSNTTSPFVTLAAR